MNQLVSLQAVNMIIRYTYQQFEFIAEESGAQSPVMQNFLFAENQSASQLAYSSESMAKADFSKQDSAVARTRQTVQSPAQQRYNLRQQENKLLIGDSEYIEPRTEYRLIDSSANAHYGLHLPARELNHTNYDWLTVLLLIALVLFASLRTIWGKYIVSLFQSVINYPTSIRMFQEKNTSTLQGAFQLDVIFYLLFSAFIFQLFNFFSIQLPYGNLKLYLFSLGLISVYFLSKKLIYRFLGFLVEKPAETGEFLYNMDNFARVAGIVLLPVVTVIAFYPFSNLAVPVFSGVILVAAIYFLLIIRGFIILLKKQFSIFYLFLYFCTLEILPLVLLYKILVV